MNVTSRMALAAAAALVSGAAGVAQFGPAGPNQWGGLVYGRKCGALTNFVGWCPPATGYLGGSANCSFCTAPKAEAICNLNGPSCDPVTYTDNSGAPPDPTCGVYYTGGTANGAVCSGGTASGVCYRRMCS
jgi:hypothetical protein